ncbi:MAG: nodulation protein NodH, partial [Rhodobacterales bacterium 17-64-5]
IGQRVDPSLASQTALLQGMAGFQPLDHVLREDRLDEGLAFLAGEVGLAAPGLPADDRAVAGLSRLHDDDLEKAALDAYARDYVGFGFGRWRG